MEEKHATANDWQALISKLGGVFSAHVVFSEAGEPTEIHVLASNRRNVKSIVRDVQSAISARYNVEVDYHIISVAQVTPDMLAREVDINAEKEAGEEVSRWTPQ